MTRSKPDAVWLTSGQEFGRERGEFRDHLRTAGPLCNTVSGPLDMRYRAQALAVNESEAAAPPWRQVLWHFYRWVSPRTSFARTAQRSVAWPSTGRFSDAAPTLSPSLALGRRLARLLLKDPAVVVLDEATAHLDSQTEALVREALAVALQGRTSLVIAHRLSTIVSADQIPVLDNGRIVERGRHDALVESGGMYAYLYSTHFSSFSESEDAAL